MKHIFCTCGRAVTFKLYVLENQRIELLIKHGTSSAGSLNLSEDGWLSFDAAVLGYSVVGKLREFARDTPKMTSCLDYWDQAGKTLRKM